MSSRFFTVSIAEATLEAMRRKKKYRKQQRFSAPCIYSLDCRAPFSGSSEEKNELSGSF